MEKQLQYCGTVLLSQNINTRLNVEGHKLKLQVKQHILGGC